MSIEMVDLRNQYHHIKTEMDNRILETIESGMFIGGAAVEKFSTELATYLDVKHVIPCGNGTDALQIALMALGLERGDEVITVSFTFVATTEAIALLGLVPIFVDINPLTYTIDVEQIEAAITPRTKCIIPVHLYGQCCNMEVIMSLARQYNLYVVEDNAQAIGATYQFTDGTTQKAGTIGDIGTTSFYPSKNLGGYGDGGALFTNNKALAEKIKMVANHGQREKYVSHDIGINSRLDSIQAAILSVKLQYLDNYILARQYAAQCYDNLLKDTDRLVLPHRAAYSTHVFHQYTLRCHESIDRDVLRKALETRGIPTMIYYPVPSHQQPAYVAYYNGIPPLLCTEIAARQVISLPMHTELTDETLHFICKTLQVCLA